jgi:hypothetical protein
LGVRLLDVGSPVVDIEARIQDARARIADTCADVEDFERRIRDTWLDIQDTLAHVLVPFRRSKVASARISSAQHHLLRTGRHIPTARVREADVTRRIDPVVARIAFERSRDEVG